MTDIADAGLLALKRGKTRCGGLNERGPGRDKTGTTLRHFRLGWRCRALCGGYRCRGNSDGRRRDDSQASIVHGMIRTDANLTRFTAARHRLTRK